MNSMAGQHRDSSAILIRLAYILGNLTTNFEEARLELTAVDSNSLETIVNLAIYYLIRDGNPESLKITNSKQSKYEEFNQGNLEDALTKIIKLLANLMTEETQTGRELVKLSSSDSLTAFFGLLMASINRREVTKNEEYILNAISCTTNMLFYDTQTQSILSNAVRN